MPAEAEHQVKQSTATNPPRGDAQEGRTELTCRSQGIEVLELHYGIGLRLLHSWLLCSRPHACTEGSKQVLQATLCQLVPLAVTIKVCSDGTD